MKPDYGVFLLNSHDNKDMAHYFYGIRVDHFSRIDAETISTMVSKLEDSTEYAISFDIKLDHINKVLEAVKEPSVHSEFIAWLNNPKSLFTSFEFDSLIEFAVICAKLGDIQAGSGNENFIPLLVTNIE
ncbi:hypothetical protein AwWohl_07250 [Gammaproteobacteria bacterium]|nr:hypothetical protein AwWohl_07250 [Gammaproteobacteria bacterium]